MIPEQVNMDGAVFGLVGFPLGHSFSRGYFTEKFEREHIKAQYLNFELPSLNEYQKTLEQYPTLRGHNVTIPYKQQIIPMLDELSDEAREIGAVNVVKVTTTNGKRHLKGYNSDVIGFVESIRPMLKPHHTKALILGTGGASKAVYYGLKRKLGIEDVRFVSRRKQTTAAGETLTYDELTSDIIEAYTIIVNTTPCGMHPHTDESPMIPYQLLTNRHLLFDLVYNPLTTQFMERGEKQGATVKNGLEMLHLQAQASWDFWTGRAE